MDNPFDFEREMAITIFDSQNLDALVALKRFLQNLPGPKAIESVLAETVCRCAEYRPATFDWILDHAEHLEPELDLVQWTRCLVENRLELPHFAVGCDLRLERELEAEPWVLSLDLKTRQCLFQRSSRGEWLLIKHLYGE